MKPAIKTEAVRTADRSLTFFSAEYRENYHSVSGAMTEAVNKFVRPCKIEELAGRGNLRILDIGFGLGYNIVAALQAARSARRDCEIEIISLEKAVLHSPELKVLELPPEFEYYYGLVKEMAGRHDFQEEGIRLTLIEGDARKKIKEIKAPFDAVFLDPFSPRKNPELWTVEFFRQILERMTETAILATYSAATPVRCGLKEAGLRIGPGPGDAMKRGGTIATKNGEIAALSGKETKRLEISPERTPFYDPNLIFSREEIFEYRERLISANLSQL